LNSNQSIQRAIFAILGTAGAAATALGPRAMAADTTAAGTVSVGLEEVVVTAQRRTENLQDVPITIQATSGAQLQQLNITSVNELLKYTPNVTFSSNGPGMGNIFMRGLSYGGAPNQSQATIAPMPNVALYLDDQSMVFPGRNNDIYLVDMERVEVLEGPQGTLYGGGSQAGAIRYLTNHPKLDVTEGDVNASYGTTSGGDPNSSANATINLPIIDGKMAIRATFFTDTRGGYIDNEVGTIRVPAATTPIPHAAGPITNNAGIAGSNLNTVRYQGGRLSLAYKFNDDWDLLLQQNAQHFEADGYFASEPIGPNGQPLAPYQTMQFVPAWDKDEYNSTAWTFNGRFPGLLGSAGDLKMVYTGSYLDRNMDQQQDYSNYLTSHHGSYYACTGQGAGYSYFRSSKPTTCYPAVGNWHDTVDLTHQSHELRFTTSDENRLRALVGAFYETNVIKDVMNFNYLSIPQCDATNLAISLAGGPDCIAATGPIAPYYARNPGLRLDTDTAFGEDVRRGYKQVAFFASADLDLIPKVLTLTAGTRHYHYDEFEQGSEYYSATSSILNVPNGTQPVKGFGMNMSKSESGFKSRANLTWKITPDMLAYFTWSQGFRPGGFNRTKTLLDGTIVLKAVAPAGAGGVDKQFNKPVGYDSDNLTNYEVGFKNEWLDHRLQLNASLYQMDWKNAQLVLFDPVHLGNTTFVVNGPSYRVKGVELQLTARLAEGLTLTGSGVWNHSEQTDAPCLLANKATATGAAVGQCITQVNGLPYTNPYGILGTSPAFSPPQQYNARLHYEWNAGALKAFAMAGMSFMGSMRNQPASYPDGNDPAFNPPTTTLLRYTMESYTTYDASIGVGKDAWTLQLTGNNLSNEDASMHTSSGQFIKSEVPLRPRVMTLQFGYKF
jgi:iron complex outermembrane receptor protein